MRLSIDVINNPNLSRWIGVAYDGIIELRVGKIELGQGIGIALLQIAADELDVPVAQIRLQAGHTGVCPDQGLTAGSLSVEVGGTAVRYVCAEVRYLFVQEAARRLQIDVESVRVTAGFFHATASSTGFSYLELASSVDLDCDASGVARPKPFSARRIAGTSPARPDLLHKLFGSGFLHDLHLPGMLHGRIVRPPSQHACLLRFDPADRVRILALPGVHTLVVDGAYIGVVAEREEQAIAAVAAIRPLLHWQELGHLPDLSADQRWLRNQVVVSSVVDAFSELAPSRSLHRIDANYSRPFIAHASIGPSCGIARWDEAGLTVWTHAQGTFALRKELMEVFASEQITVIHSDGAGCYGHNGADDAALDAAVLARAAGCAVRVQWSREDEFASAPLGSAMSINIVASLDDKGRITDWQHAVWSQTHVQRPGVSPGRVLLASLHQQQGAAIAPVFDFPLPAGGAARNALPIYTLPSRHIESHLVQQPVLRSSALRALGAYANVFAIESCMDELALLAGQDPIAFRLAHLDDQRACAVLESVRATSGWLNELPSPRRAGAQRGRGIGLARYKNSGAYCAVVVEVEVTDRIHLEKIWATVDAGEVIHPDGLINQIEGGILQAASWTLKEAMQADCTRITTRSWDDYPILRFDELPQLLQVELVAHPELPPLGAGECAAGPTAGAIANALSAAIGVRVRDLPFTAHRLQQAVLNA